MKVWLWGDDSPGPAMYKKLGVSGVPLGVPEVEPNADHRPHQRVLRLAAGRGRAAVEHQGQVHDLAADELRDRRDHHEDRRGQQDVGRGSGAGQKISKGMQKTLRKQIRKDNESAKKQMERKGVKISETTPRWSWPTFDKAAQDVWAELAGKMYSKAELADGHQVPRRVPRQEPDAVTQKRVFRKNPPPAKRGAPKRPRAFSAGASESA
jgi:hypothetical protein